MLYHFNTTVPPILDNNVVEVGCSSLDTCQVIFLKVFSCKFRKPFESDKLPGCMTTTHDYHE